MSRPEPAGDPARYLAVAEDIGRRLVADAVWHRDRCTWMGDDLVADGVVSFRTFGGDLYEGTAGVAMFLGHLAKVTGDDEARRAALGGLRQAVWIAEADRMRGMGLYDGPLGVVWAATRLGAVLGDDEAAAAAAPLLDSWLLTARKAAAGEGDAGWWADNPDVLSGLAGSGAALALLADDADEPRRADMLDVATILGERLLESADRTPWGWSWGPADQRADGDVDVCGLAHGTSGVAYGLVEIAAATDNPALRDAAAEGFRFERAWFNREASNWADLRSVTVEQAESGDPLPCAPHWCQGAAGVGLVRLRVYQRTGDNGMLAEAGAALHAARLEARRAFRIRPTEQPPFEANFSQCHGLGGVGELFTVAAEVLRVPEHLSDGRRIGDYGIAVAAANGDRWPCGLYGGGETPGLMLGLAGIGVLYLRLYDPAAAPPTGILGTRGPGAS